METGASLTVKNIGKPCTGKSYARFDEGALMKVRSLEHVVAACGKASIKDPKDGLIQCSTLPGIPPSPEFPPIQDVTPNLSVIWSDRI